MDVAGSKEGLVSVVIPAYNAADTIARAIASARSQDYRPIEIIVVDDASKDETCATVEALAGNDLTLIRQPVNGCVAEARNVALSLQLVNIYSRPEGLMRITPASEWTYKLPMNECASVTWPR